MNGNTQKTPVRQSTKKKKFNPLFIIMMLALCAVIFTLLFVSFSVGF